MRPEEGNPLDLNNLPGEDSSAGAVAGGYRKKKNGCGKDESGKIYECRFCSLRFGKSQALGGHMNRHRQERETETLNRARQLVFSNDNLMPPTPPPHPHLVLGSGQLPISHGGYHHQTSDPYRTAGYPASRYYCGSSSSGNIPPPPPPPQSYMYPSPPRLVPYPPPHYNISPPINDYFVGHAVHATSQLPSYTTAPIVSPENNYTCIGAPVGGHGFKQGGCGGGGGEMSLLQNNNKFNSSNNNSNEVEGEGRSYPNSSMINQYQDGF
ncbi:zinc finger protein JAGGED-like isoform X1 [Apium graveolens]|uniref:zinc finger protein JAGGED-like isoform X1 n=1 Tax=Apium graveolens TaxID=4045 RepID=UPI003D7BCBA5